MHHNCNRNNTVHCFTSNSELSLAVCAMWCGAVACPCHIMICNKDMVTVGLRVCWCIAIVWKQIGTIMIAKTLSHGHLPTYLDTAMLQHSAVGNLVDTLHTGGTGVDKTRCI